MEDMCKCEGDICPIRDKCLRYTSYPTRSQIWFTGYLYEVEKKRCEYLILVEKDKSDDKGS